MFIKCFSNSWSNLSLPNYFVITFTNKSWFINFIYITSVIVILRKLTFICKIDYTCRIHLRSISFKPFVKHVCFIQIIMSLRDQLFDDDLLTLFEIVIIYGALFLIIQYKFRILCLILRIGLKFNVPNVGLLHHFVFKSDLIQILETYCLGRLSSRYFLIMQLFKLVLLKLVS